MCGHELDCITAGAAMWRRILDDADELTVAGFGEIDPGWEIRTRMPGIIATFSPAARALMADHLAHVEDLVAAMHRARAGVT